MASTKVRSFAWVVIGLVLSACASSNLRVYNGVDQNDKNITVPPGGGGLVGHLKDALQKDGWSLVVDRGPEVTRGIIGEDVELRRADTFNTRYRLILTNRWMDFCLNGQNMYVYDVSLIDNSTGSEVFALNGRNCEQAIVEQFVTALHQ